MLKSMTFNNQRLNDIYLLEGRSKSPFHGINRNISRVGKHHRLKKTEKELLPISQPIGFVSKKDQTQVEIIERLTNWLITDRWATLSFDDEPGRSYLAILQNEMADFERMAWLRQGTLNFVAKATLGEQKTLTVGTESEYHTITGQEPTPWTAKVKFGIDANQYVLKGAYGRNITLNYDFIKGDVLEIDYDKRRVKLNGNNIATAVDLRTEWFELEPGEMRLETSHETEVTYYERYY